MSIKETKNKDGVWFDYEEIIHDFHEVVFNKKGLVINGTLIATWGKIHKIKKEIDNGMVEYTEDGEGSTTPEKV